jgi:hypothetical protein
MQTEILKIKPELDSASLNNMEKKLNGRFLSIAKKFGSGLTNILMGGGLIAAGSALVDKFLNPLQKTQDAIDKTLTKSDDIVTYSKEFGSSPGQLAILTALAKSTGLDQQALYMMINKFQNAVAEANADKEKATSVREYAGETNMVDAFFRFIQNMNKADKKTQLMVQQEVFGEKISLKASEFINTDFADQLKKLGAPSAEKLDAALTKIGNVADLNDLLQSKLELKDLINKSKGINDNIAYQMAEAERQRLAQENKNILQYDALKDLKTTTEKIGNLVEDATIGIVKAVEKTTDTVKDAAKYLNKTKPFRGVNDAKAIRGF